MSGIDESLALSHLQQTELPRFDAFPSLIHNCRRNKSLKHARLVEAQICNAGLECHRALGNYSVTMFLECGGLRDAEKVFRKLPFRYESSWTALISAYFGEGENKEAFHAYEHMKEDDVVPSTYTAVALLKGCARSKDIIRGRSVHDEMKKKELDQDVFVSSALIDMYAKCGSLAIAREIFDGLHSPGLVSWNALISGYVDHGLCEEALRCFKAMQLDGISPDSVTLSCCLKACGDIGAFDEGREMHRKAVEGEYDNLQVKNTLISMYAKFGKLVEAQEIFDCMPLRDEVSWTALISGYTDQGLGQEALTCFANMVKTGMSSDAILLSSAVKACSSIEDIIEGRKVHTEIMLKGFEEDSSAVNSLIDMYSRCCSLEEACHVFDNLSNRNVVAWTTIIGGYAQNGCYHEALNCLEKMVLEGVAPNVITFVSLLDACGNIGAVESGRKIHLQIVERGLEGDSSIDISLVNMYAECESLLESLTIFQKMKIRNAVAWSAMIRGYGMNHKGAMAVRCFEEMIKQGIKPDAITFTCLLNACSHTGHESKAQEYFSRMRQEYDVVPSIEHYVCMIDMLARSGNTYQAERFLEAQCPASEGTWGALLSACKTYGEVELGLRCFDNLCKILPKDGAWYALMTDIYAGAGRLDDAHRVEERRKHIGAWKKPGIAAIEVNNEVHKFVVGNQYPEEIACKLNSLGLNIKNEGHMPNLNLISRPISDVGKATLLHEHAEKLAIAFGLISTPQGTTLRVSKNMRMCNDCHSSSKLISQIEKREIILRDECCIHHFKDGLCSCGDLF